jgi:hypothetical protein
MTIRTTADDLSKDQNPHSCTFVTRLGDAATYLDVKRKLAARYRVVICHAIALNVFLSIADLTLEQGSLYCSHPLHCPRSIQPSDRCWTIICVDAEQQ